MKKKQNRLIIKLAVIFLLVVLYLMTNNRGKNEHLDADDHKPNIELTHLDAISSFTIKGMHLNLVFTHNSDDWQLLGERAPLNQGAIKKSALALSNLKATDQIVATNYSDFGFDDPHYFITFTDSQLKPYQLVLGHPTPRQNGYYAMLDDDPSIYIIASSLINYLIAPSHRYLDQTITPFNFTLLTNFTLRNSYGTIELSQSTQTFLSRFQFIQPYNSFGVDSHQFSDQFLMHWQSLFPFIKANIITYPPSLAAYGLEAPNAVLVFSNSTQHPLSIEIGDVADPGISYYAKLSNDQAVFTIDSTLAEQAIKIKAFDWLSKFVSLENIEKITKISFTANDFTLLARYNTTAEHGSSYFFNEQPTTESSFKNYYQQFLTIFYEGVVTEPVRQHVAYQMVFTFTDGTERSVSYLDYNDEFYAVAINGRQSPFLVGSYQLERLFTSSKKIQ